MQQVWAVKKKLKQWRQLAQDKGEEEGEEEIVRISDPTPYYAGQPHSVDSEHEFKSVSCVCAYS